MTGEETAGTDGQADVRDESAPRTRLSAEEAVELLADRGRRTMLRHLMNHPDGTVTVDELVDLVVTSGTSPTADWQRDRKRADLRVRCIQLPRLATAGVVEYDTGAERVRYRTHPRLEELLQCLDRLYP